MHTIKKDFNIFREYQNSTPENLKHIHRLLSQDQYLYEDLLNKWRGMYISSNIMKFSWEFIIWITTKSDLVDEKWFLGKKILDIIFEWLCVFTMNKDLASIVSGYLLGNHDCNNYCNNQQYDSLSPPQIDMDDNSGNHKKIALKSLVRIHLNKTSRFDSGMRSKIYRYQRAVLIETLTEVQKKYFDQYMLQTFLEIEI